MSTADLTGPDGDRDRLIQEGEQFLDRLVASGGRWKWCDCSQNVCNMVAQLRADIARIKALETALKPFTFAKAVLSEEDLPDETILELRRFNVFAYQQRTWRPSITLGQVRAARAALTPPAGASTEGSSRGQP